MRSRSQKYRGTSVVQNFCTITLSIKNNKKIPVFSGCFWPASFLFDGRASLGGGTLPRAERRGGVGGYPPPLNSLRPVPGPKPANSTPKGCGCRCCCLCFMEELVTSGVRSEAAYIKSHPPFISGYKSPGVRKPREAGRQKRSEAKRSEAANAVIILFFLSEAAEKRRGYNYPCCFFLAKRRLSLLFFFR